MKNLIKKSVIILAIFALSTPFFGQSNEGMTYQSVVRNSSNALVANAAVGVKISILKTTSTGTVVFSETHTPTTNANGLATFVIGKGTSISGNLLSIDWGSDSYFLKTETDPTGGTSYSIANTSQFFYVPYAFYAEKSANAWDKVGNVAGSGEFLGTTNDEDLVFKRNNVENMRLTNTGITMNKEIKPNGIAGLNGQTLTSNGNGTMAWKNASYNNDVRFRFKFIADVSTPVNSSSTIVAGVGYNLNPTAVTPGTGSFTINKSGLYHFDFSANMSAFTSANPATSPSYLVTLYLNSQPIQAGNLQSSNSDSSIWRTSGSGSFDQYITAPKTIGVDYIFYSTASKSMTMWLSGNLISE